MNRDFSDILSALSAEGAEYIDRPVEGLTVPVIGRADLIKNKRATGRARDAADADQLDG